MPIQLSTKSPSTAAMHLRTYSAESHSHTHDYCQWVLPLTGNLELEIGKQSGTLNSDQAAFIASHEHHCFASKNENSFLILDVAPTDIWLSNISIPRFWEVTPVLKKFLQFAKFYLLQEQHNLVINYMVKDFLIKLLAQTFSRENDDKVLLAKNWLNSNFAASINVKVLAKQCYLSASQLQRRFKCATGQGIAEYWRTVRLEQAQLLLTKQNTSIEKIAQKVGYDNLAAFSRSFIRAFGVAPSQWRKMAVAAKNMRQNGK